MGRDINYPLAYCAYATDKTVVLNSSSGGIFTLVVEWFAKTYPDNYLVAGVVWDDDYRGVHHILSAEEKKLEKMKISKYIQSRKGNIYQQIEDMLKKGKYILFTGCPCEVAGLKRYLGKEFHNLYTVDFMCKGSLPSRVMSDYVDFIEKKYCSKICGINMRYKWDEMDVWIPQFIKIDFANGKKMIREFYNTEIGHAFRIMQRQSCYCCPFTEHKKQSDFTMGDFHGANKNGSIYNKNGVSAIFVNTIKGQEIFGGISANMQYVQADASYIYHYNKGVKDPKRESFGQYYVRQGLSVALKKSLNMKDRVKMCLPIKLSRAMIYLKSRGDKM